MVARANARGMAAESKQPGEEELAVGQTDFPRSGGGRGSARKNGVSWGMNGGVIRSLDNVVR